MPASTGLARASCVRVGRGVDAGQGGGIGAVGYIEAMRRPFAGTCHRCR